MELPWNFRASSLAHPLRHAGDGACVPCTAFLIAPQLTLGPDAQDLAILDASAAVIDAYTQGPGANTDPWALTPDDADDLCGVFLA